MGKKQTFASDTSQRSITDWIRALLVLLLGLIIAHLGVTLFLLSALGTDTFTVFIQGLSRVAGLSVGTVHVIVLCILMVLMLLTTKGYVKPGTIVCAFCGGPIISPGVSKNTSMLLQECRFVSSAFWSDVRFSLWECL